MLTNWTNMLFLEQTKQNTKRITFEFVTNEELLNKLKDFFPTLKYIEIEGDINPTFYPVHYTYDIYLSNKKTKKGKPEVFGRVLSETESEIQQIIL